MKYCVPRGSPDAGETGVGALATTVAGDGAMTGRKMNPPAKPGHVRQRGVISAVALGHRQAAFAVMCSG